MTLHDRYYEPDDDIYDGDYDYDKAVYIARSIKDYMSEGGDLYPFTQTNFGEALSECGYEDKLVSEATETDKKVAIEYFFKIATKWSEDDWDGYNGSYN